MLIPAGEDSRRGESVAGVPHRPLTKLHWVGNLDLEVAVR